MKIDENVRSYDLTKTKGATKVGNPLVPEASNSCTQPLGVGEYSSQWVDQYLTTLS